MRDIASGAIPINNVAKIVGGSSYGTPENAINSLRYTTWRSLLADASSIVQQLWSEGRVEEPRIDNRGAVMDLVPGFAVPDINRGWWLDVKRGKQFHLQDDGTRSYEEVLGAGVDKILTGAKRSYCQNVDKPQH